MQFTGWELQVGWNRHVLSFNLWLLSRDAGHMLSDFTKGFLGNDDDVMSRNHLFQSLSSKTLAFF